MACRSSGYFQRINNGLGDGENDIPMIKAAGIGVAMENALDTVKEAADTITLNNDEDGVAAAIRKFIFGSSEE